MNYNITESGDPSGLQHCFSHTMIHIKEDFSKSGKDSLNKITILSLFFFWLDTFSVIFVMHECS